MSPMEYLVANWIWLLACLLIGVLLGWLLTGLPASRSRSQTEQKAAELNTVLGTTKSQLSELQTRVKTLENNLHRSEIELADARATLAGPVRLFEKVSGVSPAAVKLENLVPAKAPAIINSIVGGIKPRLVPTPQDMVAIPNVGKILEQRLYDAGIGTYWELANITTDDMVEVLQLSSVQKATLNADEVRSTALRLAQESDSVGTIWSVRKIDDLESIPGISATYEQRLYDAGITTFHDLANCSVDQLSEICRAPATMMPNYAAWISHAKEIASASDEETA